MRFTRMLVALTTVGAIVSLAVAASPGMAKGREGRNGNNVAACGVPTKAELIRLANGGTDCRGNRDVGAIWKMMGITPQEVQMAHSDIVCSNDGLISVGRHHGPDPSLDRPVLVAGHVVYLRPLAVWGKACYSAWVGQTEDGHTWAVLKGCGNGEVEKLPPAAIKPTPTLKPPSRPKPVPKTKIVTHKRLERFNVSGRKWVEVSQSETIVTCHTLWLQTGLKRFGALRSACFRSNELHNWGKFPQTWIRKIQDCETQSPSPWLPVRRCVPVSKGGPTVTIIDFWNFVPKPKPTPPPTPTPPGSPPSPGPPATCPPNTNGTPPNCVPGKNGTEGPGLGTPGQPGGLGAIGQPGPGSGPTCRDATGNLVPGTPDPATGNCPGVTGGTTGSPAPAGPPTPVTGTCIDPVTLQPRQGAADQFGYCV